MVWIGPHWARPGSSHGLVYFFRLISPKLNPYWCQGCTPVRVNPGPVFTWSGLESIFKNLGWYFCSKPDPKIQVDSTPNFKTGSGTRPVCAPNWSPLHQGKNWRPSLAVDATNWMGWITFDCWTFRPIRCWPKLVYLWPISQDELYMCWILSMSMSCFYPTFLDHIRVFFLNPNLQSSIFFNGWMITSLWGLWIENIKCDMFKCFISLKKYTWD
jgi:hypothetical protein